MTLRVGLTGGIGSGKSTIAGIFADIGIPVIDADRISRALVAPDQPAFQQIIDAFGQEYVSADGQLDRARLRELIFSSDAARTSLEAILHPRVFDAIQQETRTLTAPYCVVVIPLLIEAGHEALVDRILVIDAPEAVCLERVMTRDHINRESAQRILKAQLDREDRLAHADDIIVNDAAIEALRENVMHLHENYMRLAGQAASAD